MEVVSPVSSGPVTAEAPRSCEGSPLAREGPPLALGEGGHGDSMVYVRLRVCVAISHHSSPWARTASKWTSLESTAPEAREVG